MKRVIHRFSVWLYHLFTERNPMGIGYSSSPGAIVGALRETLRQELAAGVVADVRLNFVPRSRERFKVIVTVEVQR